MGFFWYKLIQKSISSQVSILGSDYVVDNMRSICEAGNIIRMLPEALVPKALLPPASAGEVIFFINLILPVNIDFSILSSCSG